MATSNTTPKELNAAKIIDGYTRKDERNSPPIEDIREDFEAHMERTEITEAFADFEDGVRKADEESMVRKVRFGGKARLQALD